MAGLSTRLLPVVLAALEAACTDDSTCTASGHHLFAGACRCVNGPITEPRHELGVNALGQGIGQATIGRALQLVVRKLVWPARRVDRATLGQPAS